MELSVTACCGKSLKINPHAVFFVESDVRFPF